jgi:hypothetical protein
MKGNVCKDATIEGLTTLLKLEREANIALLKRIEDDEKPVSGDLYKEVVKVIIDEAVNQKREWVGFTHEELAWLNEALNLGGRFAVIEAIEAKLKEKNCSLHKND